MDSIFIRRLTQGVEWVLVVLSGLIFAVVFLQVVSLSGTSPTLALSAWASLS